MQLMEHSICRGCVLAPVVWIRGSEGKLLVLYVVPVQIVLMVKRLVLPVPSKLSCVGTH